MEINTKKVIILENEVGFDNSIQFDFENGYFKISRLDETEMLHFDMNGKIMQIPTYDVACCNDKNMMKFIFFDVESEILESINIENVAIFNYHLNDEEYTKVKNVIANFYKNTSSFEEQKKKKNQSNTNKIQSIISINISYDLDLDGLYSVFFEYNDGYFTLCRNLDEEDEEIYIEKDDQNNAIYVNSNNIKYIAQNGKIEFIIDDDIKLEGDFHNCFIIEFPPIDFVQYADIEKALKHIFGNI